MFELKYQITDGDILAENKKIAMFYFCLFFIVAAVGLAVGIVAVVLDPQKTIFVLGIIICVFSGLLMAIALFMLVAPKNLVGSAVETGESERNVVIDKNGITVDSSNVSSFADITKIKNRKTYLAAYVGKDKVFIVKNSITSGQSFSELLSYMMERQGKLLLTPQDSADVQ
ncbi:MAG: hypothetical protein J1F71_01450 [Clostridiales bacterium]|nr:hypothetical protein [Clostridiales bacterium]